MPSLQKFAEILLVIVCGISPTIAKRKAKKLLVRVVAEASIALTKSQLCCNKAGNDNDKLSDHGYPFLVWLNAFFWERHHAE